MTPRLIKIILWHLNGLLDSQCGLLPFGAFLVFAAALLANAGSTLERQRNLLTRQIEAERQMSVSIRPEALTQQTLQAFDTNFPEGATGQEAVLSHLFSTAQAAGVTLEDGDYRRDEESTGNWGRYVATLPVKGSAQAIQDFAAKALKDEPSLSLASISFNRGRVGDAALEARLVFVLHYRKPV